MRTGILLAATPDAWLDYAVDHLPELLVDHANCEKKAASTALALIFAYPEDSALCLALSRLAREELRHFEQVERLMRAGGYVFERQKPGRYAAAMRAAASTSEPHRKLDLMLCGALIEARSCERFQRLATRLEEPLGSFYEQLARSEARHHELYIDFARAAARDMTPAHGPADREITWRARLEQLARIEAALVMTPDVAFRFHSGPVP